MYYFEHKHSLIFLQEIVKLCKELKVNIIAGPVASGAAIATATFGFSLEGDYRLTAMSLGKKGYEKKYHSPGTNVLGSFESVRSFALVDDVVETGATLKHCIQELKDRFTKDVDIRAIILSSGFSTKGIKVIECKVPSCCKIFVWDCLGEEIGRLKNV
jgi:adenine/guanine phosphoribosyltransferase-like PRPP-binding protein